MPVSITAALGDAVVRVVQYKMILKRVLIPTQDDPENRRFEVDVRRPGANTHGERRGSDRAADQRVFEGQQRHRIYGPRPGRGLRMDGANAGGPGVQASKQEEAGSHPGLPEQGHGAEPAPDNAADPELREDRDGGSQVIPAAAISEQVHRARYRAAGRSGSGAPALERARHAVHSQTGIPGVRQAGVCAPGRDLSVALVQLAPQPALPQAGRGVRGDAAEWGIDWRAAQARSARPSGIP